LDGSSNDGSYIKSEHWNGRVKLVVGCVKKLKWNYSFNNRQIDENV